jgi:hypothetical protein
MGMRQVTETFPFLARIPCGTCQVPHLLKIRSGAVS